MVVPSSLCCGLVCFMWARKSLLAQLSRLDSDVPARSPAEQVRKQNKQMRDVEIIHDDPE
jgi:hypothetical protein